jgi:hypothetical protein
MNVSTPPRLEGSVNSRAIIDETIRQSILEALAADPDIELDVTALNLGRLPAEVKASLYSRAVIFEALHLRKSADIHAPHATRLSAPELREAGNIIATHAHTFEIPQLQFAGNIHATSAVSFVARELQSAGDIDAFAAKNFEAQSLRTAGYINACFTKCFRALQLRECKMLRVPCLNIFVAPELATASIVDACSATWVIAPPARFQADIRARGWVQSAAGVGALIASFLLSMRSRVVRSFVILRRSFVTTSWRGRVKITAAGLHQGAFAA